jgi:hypothetical protein
VIRKAPSAAKPDATAAKPAANTGGQPEAAGTPGVSKEDAPGADDNESDAPAKPDEAAVENAKSALSTKATEKPALAAKDAGLSDKPATKKTPAMPRMKAAQPKSM